MMKRILRYMLLLGMIGTTINAASSKKLADLEQLKARVQQHIQNPKLSSNVKTLMNDVGMESDKELLDGVKYQEKVYDSYYHSYRRTKDREVYWDPSNGVTYKNDDDIRRWSPLLDVYMYIPDTTYRPIEEPNNLKGKSKEDLKEEVKELWKSLLPAMDTNIANCKQQIKDDREDAKENRTAFRQFTQKFLEAPAKNQEAVARQKEANKGTVKSLQAVMKQGDKIALGTTGVICACILAWKGSTLFFSQLEKYINAPALIKKTTLPKNPLQKASRFWYGKPKEESRLAEFRGPDHLKEGLMNTIEQTQRAKEMGIPFKNILLYGPPGTGKTMFAEIIAKESDLEYALFSGADFNNFEKLDQAIIELAKIVEWAEASPRGILVFVDEAESFLRERRSPDADLRSCALTEKFLSLVEKPSSNKIMWVFASNNRGAFDVAAESRIATSFHMTLPSKEASCEIFLGAMEKMDIFLSDEVKQNLYKHSHLFEGFSGRSTEEVGLEIARIVALGEKEADLNLLLATIQITRDKNASFKKEQIKYQMARYGKVITEIDLESSPAPSA